MRRLLYIALSLLLLITNAPVAIADNRPPIAAPSGIPEDTWAAFYNRVFTGGALTEKMMRFSGNGIPVAIFGTLNNNDVKDLNLVASQIKKYCGSYYPSLNFSSTTESSINIYFVPRSDFTKYIPTADSTKISSGYYNYFNSGQVSKVTVTIDNNLSDTNIRTNEINHRLSQALGLWGFSNNSNFPFYANNRLDSDGLSAKDKEFLTLFCNTFTAPGDTFSQVYQAINSQLSKIPNQVPLLKSSSDLSVDSNSMRANIRLDSVSEIWNSGETKLEWKILDKSGATVDFGEISNSENRLTNEWQVVIDDLESAVPYKFIYYFSNVIGDGKSNTTSFRTEKAAENTPAERVEQTLTVFTEVTSVLLSQKVQEFEVTSNSGLEVQAISKTPSVCKVTSNQIALLKAGTCSVELFQPGDNDFLPSDTQYLNFEIKSDLKSIVCMKGTKTKKVTGINPKCPVGYKKR